MRESSAFFNFHTTFGLLHKANKRRKQENSFAVVVCLCAVSYAYTFTIMYTLLHTIIGPGHVGEATVTTNLASGANLTYRGPLCVKAQG